MGSYEIIRRGFAEIDAAERVQERLSLEAAKGLSSETIEEWTRTACWFPHLRQHETVLALERGLPSRLRTGELCEPQILWAMPETYDGALWPHLDREPPWAAGRRYIRIVGVALTFWHDLNGSPHLYPKHPDLEEVVPFLGPGDLLVMDPSLWHTRGINRTTTIRAGVYFRYLEEKQ